KVGQGNLILPSANTYRGLTDIQQGWVTAENNNSLGGRINTIPVPSPFPVSPVGQGDTAQPGTTVRIGAALHLFDPTGTGLSIPENLTLQGDGIDHPFSDIAHQGAVENINGNNTLTGTIYLEGQVGIGVNKTFGPSQLITTGTIGQKVPVLNVAGSASGTSQ